MKALIELKLAHKIDISESPRTYETIIDQILNDGGFYLTGVSIYPKVTKDFVDFRTSEIDNLTLIRVVTELDETQIREFKIYKNSIMEKVLEVLGDRYLDVLNISESD